MVKLGIIGTGGMAEYQAQRFSKIEGCQLWACKDQHAEHSRQFAERFHIPHWYTDLDRMLSKTEGLCDAYTCAVLDERHAYIGNKMLSSGKPLLMEKPLGRTLSEAKQLMELAQQTKVINLVNFSKRNAPALWALNTMVKNKAFGHIHSIRAEYHQSWVATKCWGDWLTTPRWRWRLQPQTSTAGIIGDLGSHIVDSLLLLFGPLTAKGTAQIIRLDEAINTGALPAQNLDESFYNQMETVPVKAAATFSIPLPDGSTIPGTIDLSWINQEATDQFKITLMGEKRYALLDLSLSRNQIYIYDQNHNINEIITHPAVSSTYEIFINLVEKPSNETMMPIPDFKQGYLVHHTLNDLFPGVLPV